MLKFILKVSAVIILFIAFAGFAFTLTYAATSTPSFCKSCHEIKPIVLSWEQSPHDEVHCFACHESRRPAGFIESKARGLSYLFTQYSQENPVPSKPIVYENKCISCHVGNNNDFPDAPLLKRQPVNHLDIVRNDRPCKDCHAKTGHEQNFGLEEVIK